MAATWPPSLPQAPLVAGFTETPRPNVLRSQMDDGPGKSRQRSNARIYDISMSMFLTKAQKGTLDTFFETTLADGSLEFDWVRHTNGAAISYQFREPPAYTQLGADAYTVAMQFETIP